MSRRSHGRLKAPVADSRTITLSESDAMLFCNILRDPPLPNAKLKKAAYALLRRETSGQKGVRHRVDKVTFENTDYPIR